MEMGGLRAAEIHRTSLAGITTSGISRIREAEELTPPYSVMKRLRGPKARDTACFGRYLQVPAGSPGESNRGRGRNHERFFDSTFDQCSQLAASGTMGRA